MKTAQDIQTQLATLSALKGQVGEAQHSSDGLPVRHQDLIEAQIDTLAQRLTETDVRAKYAPAGVANGIDRSKLEAAKAVIRWRDHDYQSAPSDRWLRAAAIENTVALVRDNSSGIAVPTSGVPAVVNVPTVGADIPAGVTVQSYPGHFPLTTSVPKDAPALPSLNPAPAVTTDVSTTDLLSSDTKVMAQLEADAATGENPVASQSVGDTSAAAGVSAEDVEAANAKPLGDGLVPQSQDDHAPKDPVDVALEAAGRTEDGEKVKLLAAADKGDAEANKTLAKQQQDAAVEKQNGESEEGVSAASGSSEFTSPALSAPKGSDLAEGRAGSKEQLVTDGEAEKAQKGKELRQTVKNVVKANASTKR